MADTLHSMGGMVTLGAAGTFGVVDWATLAGYFVLLGATGWWFNRRKQTGTEDYFLAGRRMPVWAVAISILATAQSAATFIGAPQQSYVGDLSYLSSNIGGIVGALVLAAFFVPAFYRQGVFTPYQLLETRFGRGAKVAGSLTYLAGRVLATGSRTFIGAIPASIVIFGDTGDSHLLITVGVMSVVGIVYTLVGGAGSVIWTDVIQAGVYLGAAAIAVGLLLHRIPAGFGEIIAALQSPPSGPSKLAVVHLGLSGGKPALGFDPSQEFTLLTSVLCFSLLTLASHGTDNDLVSRQLACRTAKDAAWSVISGVLIGIPAVMLFLSIGLLLYIFYQRPDIMGAGAPGYPVEDTRRVFVSFILHEMPSGLAGLMMAGLFAAGLSTVNSSLNSMSSAFVNDLYKSVKPGRGEAEYLLAGRLGVVLCGLVVGLFSCVCVFWQKSQGQTLISFALGVMTFAYAGLLGVFLCALFTRRGSGRSVVAALLTGFVVVGLLQKGVWELWAPRVLGDSAASVSLNYPWHLFIGAVASFLVCVSSGGKPLSPSPRRTPVAA